MVPGTCDGDSGGPSLLPAGVAQPQQVVVGVQSYGNSVTCAQVTFGVASRVSSEIGPGMFITSYLENAPVGVQMGAPAPAVPALGGLGNLTLAAALAMVGRRHLTRARRLLGRRLPALLTPPRPRRPKRRLYVPRKPGRIHER